MFQNSFYYQKQQRTTSFFPISPFFQNYLNPQFRTNEIANSNVYQLLSSRLASRIINKLYVSAEGLWNFHLLLYSTMCVEKFQFYGVRFPRKCIGSRHFYSCPHSHSKFQADFFENLFPPTAETGRQNYELLYQNSIRNYEGDLKHQVIYVSYNLKISKCGGFTIL